MNHSRRPSVLRGGGLGLGAADGEMSDDAPRPQLTPQQQQWVIEHQPLIKKTARIVRGRYGFELDELMSAGSLALVDAARTFDSSRNESFEGFAKIRLLGEMIDSGARARRSDAAGLIRAANKFALRGAESIEDPGGAFATDEDTSRRVAEACSVLAAAFVTGLGAAVAEEPAQPDHHLEAREESTRRGRALKRALARLTSPQRQLIARHHLGAATLQSLATELGQSERTIRRRCKDAFEALRDAVLDEIVKD